MWMCQYLSMGVFELVRNVMIPINHNLIKITGNSLGEKVAVLQNQDNPE